MKKYREIISEAKRETGRGTIKTCWVAHCKELEGLPIPRSHNRKTDERKKPCPPELQEVIRRIIRENK